MSTVKTLPHIHFIGIGGVGMSAIAHVLVKRGHPISGSDLIESDIVKELRELGATVFIGQDPENLAEKPDLVVHSTAIREDNPELAKARRLGIPILHRAQMLGQVMKAHKAICVAGSHGKTTTSSMISLCLEKLGKEPSFVVGGVINEIGSNAKNGSSEWFVAEADESDGSFLNLKPWFAIVTNIDEDHLDHYKDLEAIKAIFRDFLAGCEPEGKVLLCADDAPTMSLKDLAPGEVLTYGFSDEADFQIRNRQQQGPINEADIYHQGELLGHLRLKMPGVYSILNATAALVACMETGLKFQDIADVLENYTGTQRRFQIIGESKGVIVVDDYAHHPSEIHATLLGARDHHPDGSILAFFQPHRYTRTSFLAEDFARALDEADAVYLLEVYPAGEDPIPGVSSQLIIDQLKSHPNARVLEEDTAAHELAQLAKENDLILVMGAGSIWRQADAILKALEER